GSPPYMSPEQWVDALSVGPRSDLYSLAIMAYEALTGRQPFVGPTIAAIGEQHCNAEVPPVGDQFPAALDRVFRRALAKNPDDRPSSALAFARQLRAAAQAQSSPGLARPTRRDQQPTRPRAQRRAWIWAGGIAALSIAGLATYAAATRDGDERPPPVASASAVPPPIVPETAPAPI